MFVSLSTPGKGVAPRYLPPPPSKVPTPPCPRYLPPPTQGAYPRPGQDGGVPQGTYPHPWYLPPPIQVRTGVGDTPKVPTPAPHPRYLPPVQVRRGRGYPKVPTHPPSKVLTPPPLSRSGQGRGYPKVPTPPSPG